MIPRLRALALLFSAAASTGCGGDGAMASQASFLNTRWRAVEVDGVAVTVPADQREPYVRLMSDGNRMEGWAGCNRLTGGLKDDAKGFEFIGIATTLMMCGPETAAFEKRYITALNAATEREVVGETLELRDSGGKVRVRFESLYLN